MSEVKVYWPVDQITGEVAQHPVTAAFRGGVHHIPKTALQQIPVDTRLGFVVIATYDDHGNATGSELREDHRAKTIYNKSSPTKSKIVSEVGGIDDGWTLEPPTTKHDDWVNNSWITNLQKKYECELKQVMSVRRAKYADISDPLMAEAVMMRRLGDDSGALLNEQHAEDWYARIKEENPLPSAP